MSASIWNPAIIPTVATVGFLSASATHTEWQTALNTYKVLYAYADATYNFTDELVIPENVELHLQGAVVNFNVTGNKYGFFCASGASIVNGEIHHTNATDEPGVNGSFRSCVTVGSFNAGPGLGGKRVRIENVIMSTVRPSGQCVSIYADSAFVEIAYCTITNGGTAKNGIAAHWSLETGTPADGIRHPGLMYLHHNNFVDFSVGVYLSAAYMPIIEANRFEDCIKGIEWYRGDYSNSYALQGLGDLVGRGARIIQNHIYGATIGIEVDGIEGLVAAQEIMEATIEDNYLYGVSPGIATDRAIYLRGTSNIRIIHNRIVDWKGYGIDFVGNTSTVTINENTITGCKQAAIWSRDGDVINDITICNNKIYLNAAENAASDKPHIRICSTTTDWTLKDNKFGASGETATSSILITPGAVRPVLHNNETSFLAAAGYAYRVSGATSLATTQTMMMDYRGNTAAAGITLYDGSPCSEVFGPNQNLLVFTNAAPTVGTWKVGDRVLRTPVVGQPVGWNCTGAGTPGIWTALANL